MCVQRCAREGKRIWGTYISQHVPVHSDELGELAVRFVYLARAAPQTRRNGHRREDAVIVEEQALESFFDEDEVLQRSSP